MSKLPSHCLLIFASCKVVYQIITRILKINRAFSSKMNKWNEDFLLLKLNEFAVGCNTSTQNIVQVKMTP